ncbi:MAG: Eco57I restriction-modification methylase domain-containing protein [Candidatus Heimdallarchaeota archaeon]|nr:MAG: Eco57I restriction-modification methylase domain-containing protein [Candidatus Heimdallarchaeota archaeon]
MTETAINQYLTGQLNSLTSSTFSSLEEILHTTDLSIIQQLRGILNKVKILDGAAGDGEFLRACLTTITSIEEEINQKLGKRKTNFEATILEILSSNLFGMEIDSRIVASCHKNLLAVIPEPMYASVNKILSSNIIIGDFLESTISDWTNLPPAIKGFDIIIGNPPWGGRLTKTQREHYYNKFKPESPKRNLNTFSLFVYQAANLLIPNRGMLAYLLPKNVVRSNQYIYLRKFLLNNFQILSINFHGLFKDVTQEFISLIGLFKNKIPTNHIILIDNRNHIPQTSYLTNIDCIFTREFDSQSQELIQLIHENSSSLAHFITVRRGEELSKRGGIMFCSNCTEWVPLSSRKPQVVCSQCYQPLAERDLKTNFLIQKEATARHTQPILTGDDFEAFSIKTTHFIDPTIRFRSKKDPSIYRSPKIVVQKIKPYLCGAYDSDNYWTTQNVYNLRLVPEYANKPDLLYYILSVLNSSLYQWFYQRQFNLGSKYTNAISIRNLRRLPLKKPDFSDPLFHQIVQLSKKMTEEQASEKDSIQELDELILRYYHCEIPNV